MGTGSAVGSLQSTMATRTVPAATAARSSISQRASTHMIPSREAQPKPARASVDQTASEWAPSTHTQTVLDSAAPHPVAPAARRNKSPPANVTPRVAVLETAARLAQAEQASRAQPRTFPTEDTPLSLRSPPAAGGVAPFSAAPLAAAPAATVSESLIVRERTVSPPYTALPTTDAGAALQPDAALHTSEPKADTDADNDADRAHIVSPPGMVLQTTGSTSGMTGPHTNVSADIGANTAANTAASTSAVVAPCVPSSRGSSASRYSAESFEVTAASGSTAGTARVLPPASRRSATLDFQARCVADMTRVKCLDHGGLLSCRLAINGSSLAGSVRVSYYLSFLMRSLFSSRAICECYLCFLHLAHRPEWQ